MARGDGKLIPEHPDNCLNFSGWHIPHVWSLILPLRLGVTNHYDSSRHRATDMEVLAINATTLRRADLSSRGASRNSKARCANTHFKMDETYSSGDNQHSQPQSQPVVTNTKAVRCYRPKEWSPEAEEAFRVQQTGWRDIKEYMETYGEPDRWYNGFVRCTRVKSNGYYTYWRPHRECDDKYLYTVKLFEYA